METQAQTYKRTRGANDHQIVREQSGAYRNADVDRYAFADGSRLVVTYHDGETTYNDPE